MSVRIGRLTAVVGLIAGVGLLVAARPAQAQDTQNFTIQSFSADYYVDRDAQHLSQMRVVEKIVVQFPNYDQNHGILRALPQTYQKHSVDLAIDKVTNALGTAVRYSTDTSNNNLVLKIGDPDKYVHGVQEYDITYHMRNVTAKFNDHDELFWDANGDQWQQPFGTVTARVHIPNQLSDAMRTDKRCYTGTFGSTEASCSITTTPGKSETVVTFATTRTLQSAETLSFVLGFAPGTFAAYQVPVSDILWLMMGLVIFGVLPIGLAGWIVARQWRKFGRDAKGRGIIVPQYVPPKEISVLSGSEIIRQRFVPSAVSAQILDLAVRHYCKIYETTEKKLLKNKSTYSIELIKSPADLRPEELEVIEMLFGTDAKVGKKVDLDDLANKLYKKAGELGKSIDKQLAADGYFVLPPQEIWQRYLTWGIVLCVLGFIFPPFTLGVLGAGVVVLVAARLMPARTQKGVDMRDYLYGLRDYMKLAEADRIKALQSPNGKLTEKIDIDDKTQLVKLYEHLLPYAMLFGIEREWAKQFADLYQDKAPDWYVGGNAFNAVYFASALHGFASASAASFTPPSNSSSSGFSGGGAGGGGGGGGGGGW